LLLSTISRQREQDFSLNCKIGGFPLHKFVSAALAAALLLSGCATSPKDISAAYVSPLPYQNLSCEQLAAEAQRVSAAAAAANGQQSDAATKDAVMTTVSLVLFWPAVFFIGGDKASAAEVSRLKGEMQAIEQANIAKNCGMQFQKG
jgi:hypothetical protein